MRQGKERLWVVPIAAFEQMFPASTPVLQLALLIMRLFNGRFFDGRFLRSGLRPGDFYFRLDRLRLKGLAAYGAEAGFTLPQRAAFLAILRPRRFRSRLRRSFHRALRLGHLRATGGAEFGILIHHRVAVRATLFVVEGVQLGGHGLDALLQLVKLPREQRELFLRFLVAMGSVIRFAENGEQLFLLVAQGAQLTVAPRCLYALHSFLLYRLCG